VSALEELLAAAAANPHDVRVLQRIGELYHKRGAGLDAAYWFTKAAEEYQRDGFFLQGIALFKQVLRLAPKQPEIERRLAELHVAIGLRSEAWTFFGRARQGFLEANDFEAARAVVERVYELGLEDPNPPRRA